MTERKLATIRRIAEVKSIEGAGMNNGVKREGLVFKHNNSEFSFKAISNSYLLKEK